VKGGAEEGNKRIDIDVYRCVHRCTHRHIDAQKLVGICRHMHACICAVVGAIFCGICSN
jgi:hypothetical protein